ncbi:hypothetical protein HDC94_001360 [Leifsonia sp. AK011]|uniref:hypothetical protein n=1 Tax=Leifsonia sp. AK011 TaxID=2723075 RepID=UPI0015CE45F0|nr:hypothetical protein [Leifsonia sp. AK011]NYF10204.1 hypothetical protein [Leifsonia sp. AK011]
MSENIPQYGEYAPTPPVNAPQPAPAQPVAPQYNATLPPYAGAGYYQPAQAAPKKPGLGIAALIIAIAVFVISMIWAIANGFSAASIPGLVEGSFEDGFQAGAEAAESPQGAAFGLSVLGHVVVGTLAGVTALVLGIIAIVQKRGRAQGIVATVIAVIAPIVSYFAYSIVVAAAYV